MACSLSLFCRQNHCVPCVRSEAALAGERGFEPRLTDSESVVLPLDDSPALESESERVRQN